MTTVFEGSPTFVGISGDSARVIVFEDRVLIAAIDAMSGDATAIAMTPAHARALAEAIKDAAAEAEGGAA